MKSLVLTLAVSFFCLQGTAQEERERTFRDFRGHELLAFQGSPLQRSAGSSSGEWAHAFSVYPNPGTSHFTVLSEVAGTLGLFNEQGISLATLTITEGKNELDLKDYLPGIYYLRESAGNKLVARLIVSK